MQRTFNLILHGVFGFVAGCIYLLIELIWRGHTHWTMLPLAAIIFICAGLLDESKNPLPFWGQVAIGTLIATVLELVSGLILNICLGLQVWDYSNIPGNLMGQICPQFTIAWAFLMIISIKLENFMHKMYDKLIQKGGIKNGR